ncbi:MAG: hypothetical protein ACD_79C00027G0003 [uncultured bacterium]|nr:MAG: hypothetical protein ACD_79C00027G0003 [uncultured bacterium]
MLSALSFHEATNEIPKQIDVAIPRGTHENNITYPPVKFYHYDSKTYETGIENYDVGGRKIKIYCLARTVADCFKFRNKIGVDVARNALKIAINEKKIKPKEVMYYAKICRVENIIKPILETIL